MAYEMFTDEWARAYGEELNRSAKYREAAKRWEWPLALTVEADPGLGIERDRSVLLDLWHGECRSARMASPEDLQSAPYAISADPYSWKQVLDGQLEPISGLMRGKLKLTRGNMIALAGYLTAAKELVACATRLDTILPAGLQ